MTIEEGNKLIAEFMGIEEVNCNQSDRYRLTSSPYSGIFTMSHCRYLHFDRSYEWLMPVVEKIEQLDKGYKFQVCRRRVQIMEDSGTQLHVLTVKKGSKRESIWEAVVQFIQWHNQTNHGEHR